MAVNAFIKFSNDTKGESKQKGFEGQIELQGWDWEVEAESSWIKGGGASVGKAVPGKLNIEHYFDKSSPAILIYICTGKSFDSVELTMCKTTGSPIPEKYFIMKMDGIYITKVSNSGTEEGNVAQKIELVFKKVSIEYKPQKDDGKLDTGMKFQWDIPSMSAS